MENINQLYSEYNLLLESINKENDSSKKIELQNNISLIEKKLKEELKLEHERGNVAPEFIQIYGRFIGSLDFESNKEEEKVQDNEEVKQNYSLSSEKIVSLLTGEEIDLSKMTRINKIKTIYEHTGIEITIADPEIIDLCDKRFNEFLRGCNPSTYEQKYGSNWKEEVEKIYKQSYLDTVHKCIANGLNEIDEKKNNLQTEALEIEKQKNSTSERLVSLQKEEAQLQQELAQLHNSLYKTNEQTNNKTMEEHKQDLIQLKKDMLDSKQINDIINTNAELETYSSENTPKSM